MTTNNSQKNRLIFGLLLLLSIITIGGGYLVQRHRDRSAQPLVVSATSLSPEQFHTESVQLITLMKQKGMKDTFAYVSNKMATDPSFAKDCHPLLHGLGDAAYIYYGGYSQAIKYQNEICNSGYTHGVLEEYLTKTPDINQAITIACGSRSAEDFAQWQCFHGIGHGIMLASNKNVTPAIKLCESLLSKFSVNACVNGVFMEHFVVIDHDGNIPTIDPTSLNDCLNQNYIYKGTCYLYAPTAYLTLHNAQYMAALKWCNGAEESYIATCTEGVGSQSMKDNINNPAVSRQVCQNADEKYRTYCVSGVVGMYIYFNGSSSAAQSLCQDQFVDYQATCQATISGVKDSLKI